ncbi:hypothetical protein GQ44DRAFT_783419 [Phaeosphaeriaceae sp. PMI808]|nr:hypothetical protein GQ44DRAFT_783419 [Phaeosphaeriaceae sp. PMI808]
MTRSKRLELGAVDGLGNERCLCILGIIDKPRELGVGEDVSLPQIVLRRAPAVSVAVKISTISGLDAQGDEETPDRLLSFERTLSVDEFDSERLLDIFDEITILCRIV